MSIRDEEGRPDLIEDEPLSPGARFTRRSFLATTGGAVAAAALLRSRPARAAEAPALTADTVLRIHPAIGFARLGNAPGFDDYFIGPECPGFGPEEPVESFKDPAGNVKRQAARFRLFQYSEDGEPLREINRFTPGVANIEWRVHLANKKASFHTNEGRRGDPLHGLAAAPLRNLHVAEPDRRERLEIDFGARTVDLAVGVNAAVQFTPGTAGAYPKADPQRHPNLGGGSVIPYLGELRRDEDGNLLVFGGRGAADFDTESQPEMPHWANNDHWFDDAADGPVTAVVTLAGGAGTIEVDPQTGAAWVLCGPPDFAPGVPCSVSAYDLLYDLAVRELDLPDEWAYQPGGPLAEIATLKGLFNPGAARELAGYQPHFGREIEPILIAAYNLWWINGLVTSKHNSLLNPALGSNASSSQRARTKVYSYMRPPLGAPAGTTGPGTMPKLMGDEPYIGALPDAVRNLALTHVQYGLLGQWADGAFEEGMHEPPYEITAHGLDRAALENCVGGAFFPGIEFGWQMRIPNLFTHPFRVDHTATVAYLGPDGQPLGGPIGPGHFIRQMAVPWQADFNDCRNEGNYGWWPSQRPTHALPSFSATKRLDWARPTNRFIGRNAVSTHEDMVTNWYRFGFVVEVKQGNETKFIETERTEPIV